MQIIYPHYIYQIHTGGQHHTLLLTNDDRCQVIGRRDYGRLGIGQVADDVKTLTEVTALTGKRIVQVACGESCSFARSADGLVYAWGIGSNQQLGVGSEEDAYEPVLLTGVQVKGKDVLNVNGGGQHTLLLVANASGETTTNGSAATTSVSKANGAAKITEPAKQAASSEIDGDNSKTPAAADAVEAASAADSNPAADVDMIDTTTTVATKQEKKIAVSKKKNAAAKAGIALKKVDPAVAAAETESGASASNEHLQGPAAEAALSNANTDTESTTAAVDDDANESVKSSKSNKSKASKTSADTKKKPAVAASKAPAKKRKL